MFVIFLLGSKLALTQLLLREPGCTLQLPARLGRKFDMVYMDSGGLELTQLDWSSRTSVWLC